MRKPVYFPPRFRLIRHTSATGTARGDPGRPRERFHGDLKTGLLLALALLLPAGCSIGPPVTGVQDGPPHQPVNASGIPDAVPRVEPRSRYGNPDTYVVNGKRYYTLRSSTGYEEQGIASWYGTKFHGRRTSSGEPYDMFAMTAAHKSLPLPTYARVSNLQNGRSVVVKVNDRGPFHPNRIIDLSYAAAARLGILDKGTGLVKVQALDPRHPEKPAPRSAAAGSAKPFLYLQVGAFSNRYNARRLRNRLLGALAGNIRIQKTEVPDRPLYRVQVGPVSTIEKADALTVQLARLGIQDIQVVIE